MTGRGCCHEVVVLTRVVDGRRAEEVLREVTLHDESFCPVPLQLELRLLDDLRIVGVMGRWCLPKMIGVEREEVFAPSCGGDTISC